MDLEVVESKLVKLMIHLKSLVMLVLWSSSADIPMICRMTLMKNFGLFWLIFQLKKFRFRVVKTGLCSRPRPSPCRPTVGKRIKIKSSRERTTPRNIFHFWRRFTCLKKLQNFLRKSPSQAKCVIVEKYQPGHGTDMGPVWISLIVKHFYEILTIFWFSTVLTLVQYWFRR